MSTTILAGIEPPSVFAKLDEELANLPRKYAEADGAPFLASVDGQGAGCIGGHDHHSIEATRLLVRPSA